MFLSSSNSDSSLRDVAASTRIGSSVAIGEIGGGFHGGNSGPGLIYFFPVPRGENSISVSSSSSSSVFSPSLEE